MFEVAFGLAAGLAYVCSVALILRCAKASPAALATVSSLVDYVLLLALVLLFDIRASFWALSISYWFVAVSFLMVFGAVYKSISLRMLLDVYERPGRAAPEEAIRAGYVEADSFDRRLDVMLRSGMAEKVEDGYLLLPKGRRLAVVAAALQKAFAIERSG